LRYPKISRRHRWSAQQIEAYLENRDALSIVTPGELTLSIVREDPSDNRYLECAIEGEAGYLVTGDKRLLALEEFQGIEIMPPREFLDRLT
jgi:predicted nucleic acid-binding protein